MALLEGDGMMIGMDTLHGQVNFRARADADPETGFTIVLQDDDVVAG